MSECQQIYVCMNADCKNRGAADVLSAIGERISAFGLGGVEVKPYMCFSACNIGPNVVIPSGQNWFSGVKPADAGPIVDYLMGGAEPPGLAEESEPDLKEMIFAIIDAGLIPE